MDEFDSELHILSDENIERYVRFPDTLEPELRDDIAAAIVCNSEANAIAEFYRDCYYELDRLGTRSATQLEQFIASIYPIPRVTPLYPIASLHQKGRQSSSPFIPTMRSNGFKALLEPVALLGSRQTSTMVCLLRHYQNREKWRLFVLTEDLLKRANILVSFPEIGLDVLVDGSGSADFSLPDEDVNVEVLNAAILRLPEQEIRIQDGEIQSDAGTFTESGLALPSGHLLRFEHDIEGCAVLFDTSEANFPYKYRRVAYTDGEGRIDIRRIAQEGRPVRFVPTSRRYCIRLYE